MARYSKAHKERSRAAILQAAATLFRQRGFNGVSIDELCNAAGLTRGTFYAHFQSKSALFDAVMNGPHDFVRRLAARTDSTADELLRSGIQVAQDYLDAKHRPGVLRGCSLATLGMDTVRGDKAAQQAYAQTVKRVVAEFRRDNDEVSEQSARAALALCVGGLLVGSACGEDPEGNLVATAAQEHVKQLLEMAR